jgi:hypothetical protein
VPPDSWLPSDARCPVEPDADGRIHSYAAGNEGDPPRRPLSFRHRDGVDHLIPKPREIYIDDDVGGLTRIEVVAADGRS